MTRARPSATPGHPGSPRSSSPAARCSTVAAPRTRPGVRPVRGADEHERRHLRLQRVVLGATLANQRQERRSVAVEEHVDLGGADEPEVLDLVERPSLDHPPPDLAHRHAHLVDEPDVVGLGALAPGQPGRRARDRRRQLILRFAGRRRPDRAAPPRPSSRCRARTSNWPAGSARVGRQPHPVDRRERERRAGLPGRRSGLPLVRPAAAEVEEELAEGVDELVAAPVRSATAPTSRGSAPPSRPRRCRRDRQHQIRPPDRIGDGADHARPARSPCTW